MTKQKIKSYSKYTFQDLHDLGLKTVFVELFENWDTTYISPSNWLKETLERASLFSISTEKAKSEFIISPILNELAQNNKELFSVYSGFQFNVDADLGLQGFCDFLLAKLPLTIIPENPIIAVVEAKLSRDLYDAVPQCASEMYATNIWNVRRGEKNLPVYGAITTGDSWLFLRYEQEGLVEVDKNIFSVSELEKLLGVWQNIINLYK